MTGDDARRFATRMIDTWPRGPKAYVWQQIAGPLDAALARTAVRTLEREAPHTPSPAAFHDAYARARADADAEASNDMPRHCAQCDGTGWVEAPPRQWPGERTSSQVRPCGCSRGLQMVPVQRRITQTNARTTSAGTTERLDVATTTGHQDMSEQLFHETTRQP